MAINTCCSVLLSVLVGLLVPFPACQAYEPHATATHRRALRQATEDDLAPAPVPQGGVTVVRTFGELRNAWAAGAAHIEVQAHLDSTDFGLQEADFNGRVFMHVLGKQKATTRSLRGNCAGPVPEDYLRRLSTTAPLLPLKSGQCLILAQSNLIPVALGAIWIDNLFIRFAPVATENSTFIGEVDSTAAYATQTLFHTHGGNAYVSNLTIQGDGSNPVAALVMYTSSNAVYEDFIMQDMVSVLDSARRSKVPVEVSQSLASFQRCHTIANNTVPPIMPLLVATASSSLRLQECVFADNGDRTQLVQADSSAVVYSDASVAQVFPDGAEFNESLAQEPQPLSRADVSHRFLTFQDEAFLLIQKDLQKVETGETGTPDASTDAPQQDATARQADDEKRLGGLSYVALAAIAAGGFGLFLLSLVLLAWCWRRRGRTYDAGGIPGMHAEGTHVMHDMQGGYDDDGGPKSFGSSLTPPPSPPNPNPPGGNYGGHQYQANNPLARTGSGAHPFIHEAYHANFVGHHSSGYGARGSVHHNTHPPIGSLGLGHDERTNSNSTSSQRAALYALGSSSEEWSNGNSVQNGQNGNATRIPSMDMLAGTSSKSAYPRMIEGSYDGHQSQRDELIGRGGYSLPDFPSSDYQPAAHPHFPGRPLPQGLPPMHAGNGAHTQGSPMGAPGGGPSVLIVPFSNDSINNCSVAEATRGSSAAHQGDTSQVSNISGLGGSGASESRGTGTTTEHDADTQTDTLAEIVTVSITGTRVKRPTNGVQNTAAARPLLKEPDPISEGISGVSGSRSEGRGPSRGSWLESLGSAGSRDYGSGSGSGSYTEHTLAVNPSTDDHADASEKTLAGDASLPAQPSEGEKVLQEPARNTYMPFSPDDPTVATYGANSNTALLPPSLAGLFGASNTAAPPVYTPASWARAEGDTGNEETPDNSEHSEPSTLEPTAVNRHQKNIHDSVPTTAPTSSREHSSNTGTHTNTPDTSEATSKGPDTVGMSVGVSSAGVGTTSSSKPDGSAVPQNRRAGGNSVHSTPESINDRSASFKGAVAAGQGRGGDRTLRIVQRANGSDGADAATALATAAAAAAAAVARVNGSNSGGRTNVRDSPLITKATQAAAAAPAGGVTTSSWRTADGTTGLTAITGETGPTNDTIDAADEGWVSVLGRQLNALAESHSQVLGAYVLDDNTGRRCKGTSVTQSATCITDGQKVNLVFFASDRTMLDEQHLYANAALQPLLPRLLHCSGGGQVDGCPYGHLPPFLVVDRGETLDEWLSGNVATFEQCVKLLANLAEQMEYLHEHGYVLRDMKPSNCMWLPRDKRWTIADLSSIARTGETCVPTFTLRYSAPEIIAALQNGEQAVTAQPAQDVWSLGVIAFELLTQQPAFDMAKCTPMEVIQQLKGHKPLPWEATGPENASLLVKLWGLQPCVLMLLQRNPLHRPSMESFRASCGAFLYE